MVRSARSGIVWSPQIYPSETFMLLRGILLETGLSCTRRIFMFPVRSFKASGEHTVFESAIVEYSRKVAGDMQVICS